MLRACLISSTRRR